VQRKLALVFLLATTVLAQTLPPGVQKKASLGGITEYDFPNGLKVLLFPDSSNPKVTVNMTFLVGSRHEGYGETGMAHLLEHMNFILSTNNRDIKKELTDHGANWNGTTSYDRTNYFETVTAGDENLKWALGLEAERMVNMRMEKKILDTEMTVVRNEFERGENSPQRILEERVVATAYLWHNYGKSTIGSREDIEKVPIDRLAAFYKKYYQPDNAVLTISGQLDESKTLAFVAATCGAIPKPTRKLDATYTVEPVQDGQRYVELRRVGDGQEIMMAWHAPSAGNADSAALSVLAGIMSGGGGRGGGGTGRLSKALVDNKKAISARMSFQELHDPGFVMASASLSNDQSLDDAKKAMLDTVKGIISEPPTKEEVDRVKNRMLRQMESQMNDAQQVGLGMTNPIAQGDWRLMFLNHDRLKDVTPDEIVRVAKLYFKDSNLTIGEFIPTNKPDRTEVPPTPDLDKLLDGYKSSITISKGESFDPTPANIEARVVRSKLANGMKVVLLPRQTRGGTVNAAIELQFGDEKSLAGKSAAAQMAGALLMRGTKTKSRQQIQDEMDKLNARITVTGGGGGGGGGRGGGTPAGLSGANASIQTIAPNLVPAIRLAVEMLREPAFPENDFELIRKQRIAAIEANRNEPAALAVQALARALSPYPRGDIRYVQTFEEQIEDLKKVTMADVRKFYSDFYGASHGELVVVGQFDQPALQKAAAELLGSWTNPAPYNRYATTFQKAAPVNLKLETPDKQNSEFEAGMRIRLSDNDPDYAAMLLANYMMGGSITGRIPDRIRNHEGLSYSVNSRLVIPAVGDGAIFGGMAISNPANAPKVESSFKDELLLTLKNGFTADEVAAAKKAFRDQRMVQRSQDSGILALLAAREQQGRTMKWDEEIDAKIQALTPEQINAAFRAHIDASVLSIVKAGDFVKAGVYKQ
jgi:zinc protease